MIPAGKLPSHFHSSRSIELLTEKVAHGVIKAYAGDGEFTDDPLKTFGSRAVVKVNGLQKLLRYACKNGFEHHVAMTASHTGNILAEAFETYLGWETYHHSN